MNEKQLLNIVSRLFGLKGNDRIFIGRVSRDSNKKINTKRVSGKFDYFTEIDNSHLQIIVDEIMRVVSTQINNKNINTIGE